MISFLKGICWCLEAGKASGLVHLGARSPEVSLLPIGLSRLLAWTCSPARPSGVPAITIKLFFFLSPLPDPLVRM